MKKAKDPVEGAEEKVDVSTPEKALKAVFKEIDASNPYASFLDNEALSTVTGWLDTGSMGLNGIISGSLFKGIPEGRVTLLAGPSQTGKSFIVQKLIANAQKKGITCFVFDSENAIDAMGAAALGVDPSKVKYIPITNLEDCRNTIYKMGQTIMSSKNLRGKCAIFIDSLGNIESSMQENRMEKDNNSQDMSRAKAVKSLLRTCTNMATFTKTTVVITNHIYEDPMAMFPSLIQLMPGGKAVVYLPSVTVQLARKPVKEEALKKGEVTALAVGQKSYPGVILRALTAKNRFVKQYLETEMYLSFERGLSKYYGLLELAEGFGILTKDGHKFVLASTGEVIGKYKNWKTDDVTWGKIIPEIEAKIKVEWAYGNKANEQEVEPDEVDDDEPDEEEQK